MPFPAPTPIGDHTPGPWTVKAKPDRTLMVAAPAGWYIAKVVGSTVHPGAQRSRFEADARLLAAAPALLDRLEVLLARLDGYAEGVPPAPGDLERLRASARATIAQARGQG